MKEIKTINFKGYNLIAFKSKHKNRSSNVNSVILLKNSKTITKENYADHKVFILSINLAKNNIDDNHFYLKAYHETEEIANFLLKEGYLIKKNNAFKNSPFNHQDIIVYEVEMTDKFKECIIDFEK